MKTQQQVLESGRGRMAADCSGFMKPLSGYDSTADGYCRACVEKGAIGGLPGGKVCPVFKQNNSGIMKHIGIYLGDVPVPYLPPSASIYQHRPLEATGWTHWGIPKWIDYSVGDEPETVQEGWEKLADGLRRYWENGIFLASTWRVINHHWYYFGPDGYMRTGWQEIGGEWYYLEESGDLEGACWHEKAGGRGVLERWYVG